MRVPAHNRIGESGDRSPGSPRGGQRGFTLVEILVTIGLVVVLMAMVFYPVVTGIGYMEKAIARSDALAAARSALDVMSRELAEAMYVYDPPVGGEFITFLPPRSAPEGVAPVEPQGSAIRYSAALRNPALSYRPFYQYDPDNPKLPVNPYYLARTEIPYAQAAYIDATPTGAVRLGGTVTITTTVPHGFIVGQTVTVANVNVASFNGTFTVASVPSVTTFTYAQAGANEYGGGGVALDSWNNAGGWLPRATFWYPDGFQYPTGTTWATAQPGYPWLEAVRLYTAAADRLQWYSDRSPGLTPDSTDFDVPAVRFAPEKVSGEALSAAATGGARDYARYRGRYSLWQGFVQWNPGSAAFASTGSVKVYTPPEPFTDANGNGRYDSGESYTDVNGNGQWDGRILRYDTYLDPATGKLWVRKLNDDGTLNALLYDISRYPRRDVTDPNQAEFAFGIDYDRGEVRFDFAAEQRIVPTSTDYYFSLVDVNSTLDLDPSLTADSRQIVPGSVTVRVEHAEPYTDANANGRYDLGESYTDLDSNGKWDADVTYYEEAYLDPTTVIPGNNTIGANHFAVRGATLIFDNSATGAQRPGMDPAYQDTVTVRYRYRNNPTAQVVVASYASKAVVNISLTVSRRDVAAHSPAASRQEAMLVAKVKLKNTPR